jgi:hypothetical protein
VNVQFMVKDSKKYAATGSWGFGDFTNGKPGHEKPTTQADVVNADLLAFIKSYDSKPTST